MKPDTSFFDVLWRVTHRNILGWADERRHVLTNQYQHRLFNDDGKWKEGKLRYRT